ncbi:putative dual-specificity kinase [Helianthus annuus]|nr:putative dual-specificity kinase [Helianthus annuus]
MSNSNSEKKNIIRTIEEGDFDNNNNNNNSSGDGNNNNNSNNSNHKSGTVKSGSGCSKSVCSNGSITSSDCTIDERVLVDPKLLFIGAKIGEGAHGKVYEGNATILWFE